MKLGREAPKTLYKKGLWIAAVQGQHMPLAQVPASEGFAVYIDVDDDAFACFVSAVVLSNRARRA